MTRAWMSSNGVRSRLAPSAPAGASRSTSYSRQFSSPPVSCRYSRCLPSLAQANIRMPRSASSVTTVAASQSTPEVPIGATQTLRTPSCGAIHASRVPSGEMWGLTRSGLPNSTLRGMRSTMGTCLPHGPEHPNRSAAWFAAGLPGEPAGGGRVGVVVDVLLLGVLLQARGPELAADAGLAETAPLRL